MPSAPAASGIVSETCTILPVDVEEEDGQFTRGYVQDTFDNGKVLVYFDCKNDPVRLIEPGRLFQTRKLTGFEQHNMGAFTPGDKVEVLVRLSPGDPARWYPGTVTSVRVDSLVDIEVDDGVIRNGVFGDCIQSKDMQWPLPRSPAGYVRFPVGFPTGVEADFITEEFCVAWEKCTGSLVKSVDMERKMLMVLADERHPLSPVGIFREIQVGLAGFDTVDHTYFRGVKRDSLDAESDMDVECVAESRSQVKKKRTNSLLDEGTPAFGETPTALEIPEMLVSIFRYLDLKDRHSMRGMNRSWREIIDSRQVCRSARMDDTHSPLPSTVERCRYFSQLHREHLTTIAVHCTGNRRKQSSTSTFVRILSSIGSMLVPQLKTLVLYNGRVDFHQLVSVMRMKNAPRILLNHTIVHSIAIGRVTLSEMHVRVDSGVLDSGKVAETAVVSMDELGLLNAFAIDLRSSPDDRMEKPMVYLRNFLITVLDGTPLGCPEEKVLEKVGRIREGRHRDCVRTALKVLDPGCFTPEMEIRGQPINLPKSALRRSTLMVCKAIRKLSQARRYKCTDVTCCS